MRDTRKKRVEKLSSKLEFCKFASRASTRKMNERQSKCRGRENNNKLQLHLNLRTSASLTNKYLSIHVGALCVFFFSFFCISFLILFSFLLFVSMICAFFSLNKTQHLYRFVYFVFVLLPIAALKWRNKYRFSRINGAYHVLGAPLMLNANNILVHSKRTNEWWWWQRFEKPGNDFANALCSLSLSVCTAIRTRSSPKCNVDAS